ncbi:MAG: hypothetical protein H7330_01990 [Hymenobacteraceae bacterium]|nr:hypothetical protein [Hymenobacteraceae bacterium]
MLWPAALWRTSLYGRQDGHLTRIGADFLPDAQGTVLRVLYGRFVGDHRPL